MTSGEYIIQSGTYSANIYIVNEGIVQVRVESLSDSTDSSDFWFENIEVGAAFNVYNCMSRQRQSVVSFIASSGNCSVESINFNDVVQLSKSIPELS